MYRFIFGVSQTQEPWECNWGASALLEAVSVSDVQRIFPMSKFETSHRFGKLLRLRGAGTHDGRKKKLKRLKVFATGSEFWRIELIDLDHRT
jgi:hypothetical protein